VSWRIAPALETLRAEINRAAPDRSKVSDGGIGDVAHSARVSDHNPCKCCGTVCARDFTNDPAGGLDAEALARWLVERLDPRVKYVIWNRRIASGVKQAHPPGVWRRYTGADPHTGHLHLSVRHDLANDTSAWGWPPPPAAA
jgi:hypothetical protein